MVGHPSSLAASDDRCDSIEEIICEKGNASIREGTRGWPGNQPRFDGPYLCEIGSDGNRKVISPDDTPSDFGTHDENDQMLAEANRRGLCIPISARGWSTSSLELLFGARKVHHPVRKKRVIARQKPKDEAPDKASTP